MKQHLLAIRLGCSAALLVVLSACGLSSAAPTLPSSAPAPAAAPQPPESALLTQPPAGLTDTTAAVQVVLDYYNAIAQKHYDQAYGLWAEGGAASGQTRSEFEQGYANTAGLSVLLDRATVSGEAVTLPITGARRRELSARLHILGEQRHGQPTIVHGVCAGFCEHR